MVVVVSSRQESNIASAVEALKRLNPAAKICGKACDVSDEAQCDALAAFAAKELSSIDFWVHNAGVSADTRAVITDVPFTEIRNVRLAIPPPIL